MALGALLILSGLWEFHMLKMKKYVPALVGAGVASFAVGANAAGTALDLSSLTGAVDFSTVISGIVAIGALLMGVAVAQVAVRKIIGAVKRG